MLAFFLIIISGFIFECIFQYPLSSYNGIKFGSYGFYLAQLPPTPPQDKRIVMLGNSVYQFNGIPNIIQEIVDKRAQPWHVYNMAQVGSTLYDYLLQSARVIKFKPDILIFSINQGTLSFRPAFKTDSVTMLFEKDVLEALPPNALNLLKNHVDFLDLGLSSLFRLKRMDPMIRWQFKLRRYIPNGYLKWISYPLINTGVIGLDKTVQMRDFEQSPQIETHAVLKSILEMLNNHHIPSIWIWQEAKDSQIPPDIDKLIKNYPLTTTYDFGHYWNEARFVDSIHPGHDEEYTYALRHLTAIEQGIQGFLSHASKNISTTTSSGANE